MIKVKNLDILKSLQNHEEKELALIEDVQQVYQYEDGEWVPYKTDQPLGVTLYEINQMAVQQMEDLTDEQIATVKTHFRNLVNSVDSIYYMLLCRDLNYYTMFVVGNGETDLEDDVIECLNVLGRIKSVEIYEGLIECWIVDSNDTAHVVYFFNYSEGVIECH